MSDVDFQYDLDEIVQMDGVGLISLRSALSRMPDCIGPFGALYRDQCKQPPLFDSGQIRVLLEKHRPELDAGNPSGHREADEHDFK